MIDVQRDTAGSDVRKLEPSAPGGGLPKVPSPSVPPKPRLVDLPPVRWVEQNVTAVGGVMDAGTAGTAGRVDGTTRRGGPHLEAGPGHGSEAYRRLHPATRSSRAMNPAAYRERGYGAYARRRSFARCSTDRSTIHPRISKPNQTTTPVRNPPAIPATIASAVMANTARILKRLSCSTPSFGDRGFAVYRVIPHNYRLEETGGFSR